MRRMKERTTGGMHMKKTVLHALFSSLSYFLVFLSFFRLSSLSVFSSSFVVVSLRTISTLSTTSNFAIPLLLLRFSFYRPIQGDLPSRLLLLPWVYAPPPRGRYSPRHRTHVELHADKYMDQARSDTAIHPSIYLSIRLYLAISLQLPSYK